MNKFMIMRRGLMTALALTIGLTALGGVAKAADYPAKPVSMIVPYGAGGSTDTMARVFAKALGEELGQPIVVINRKGGGGAVGASFLKSAEPDGYTILIGGIDEIVAWTANAREVDFNKGDFRYLGSVANYQNALVGPVNQPFATLKEFVSYAKSNPGTPVASQGGMDRLFLETLIKREKLDLKLVPTSGGGEAMKMLIAGTIVMSYSGGAHAKYQGTVRVLASLNGTRLSGAPDVPSFAEAGYGLTMPSMIGVMAPAGVSEKVASILDVAIQKAGKNEDFRKIVEERLKSKVELVSAKKTTKIILALEEKLRPLAKK